MKKTISVILSIIYFSLSTGAMVNLHYCGGELESVKINSEAKTCCCGSTEMASTCCSDEEFILDIDIDEIIPISSSIYLVEFNYFIASNSLFEFFNEVEVKENKFENYDLPPPKPERTWLLNCNFTLYG